MTNVTINQGSESVRSLYAISPLLVWATLDGSSTRHACCSAEYNTIVFTFMIACLVLGFHTTFDIVSIIVSASWV